MLKIKRWTLVFLQKRKKNATQLGEEHCITNFCANSTELKTKKKQKVDGQDGGLHGFMPP